MFLGIYSRRDAYMNAPKLKVSRHVKTIRNDGTVVAIPTKDLAKIAKKAKADNG